MLALLNRSNRWFMLAVFLLALGYGLWMNLRPLYLERLGATPEQVGAMLGLVALVGGVLPIPAGILADRIGPKRIMIAGYLAAATGATLSAFASTWVMAGVGFAVFTLVFAANPASSSLVLYHASRDLNSNQTSRVMAIVFASWPAAMVFAPALGGVIADRFGLPIVWGIGALLILVAGVVVTRTTDAPPAKDVARPSARALLRNRPFLALVVFFPLVTLAVNLGIVLAPNFLESTRGLSLSVIGLLFSVFSIGTLLFNSLVGKMPMPRFVGVLLIAQMVGLVLLIAFPAVWVTGLSFILLGTLPTIWVVSQSVYGQSVPVRQRGIALGVGEALAALGTAVASGLAGQLYDRTPDHSAPMIAGLVMLAALLLALVLIPALRRAVASHPTRQVEVAPTPVAAGD